MVVRLLRTYEEQGTNGEIYIDGDFICKTIELPWLNNARNISCIPEGLYPLAKRFSKKFNWHILVKDVPGRSEILFHPANDAKRELRGCIAPVSELLGMGRGIQSRVAFERLKSLVYDSIDRGNIVCLEVVKNGLL